MKVQAHSSLEPPLEYNQDQMPLMNQGLYYDLSNDILSYGNIMQFEILILEGKTGNEIPESPRLDILEKFLANNFALSDAENNTSGPLNRGGIADLPLLRTLLAIRQKSSQSSFWEVMDSFVLVAYTCLAASRILLE